MFLLQFSGQGVVTFYTAEIFKEAESAVDPNDCALVIGVTYFLSSILGLVLKKHVGRRFLLLASELGMAVSQLAMGIYFYVLSSKFHYHHRGMLIINIPLRQLKVAILKLPLPLPLLQSAIMEIWAILKAQTDAATASSNLLINRLEEAAAGFRKRQHVIY